MPLWCELPYSHYSTGSWKQTMLTEQWRLYDQRSNNFFCRYQQYNQIPVVINIFIGILEKVLGSSQNGISFLQRTWPSRIILYPCSMVPCFQHTFQYDSEKHICWCPHGHFSEYETGVLSLLRNVCSYRLWTRDFLLRKDFSDEFMSLERE